MEAKPGDFVQVTIYAKVKESFIGGSGGYWLDIHGVSMPAHDVQIHRIVSVEELSIKAQRILQELYNAKGGYLATWSLSHLLDTGAIFEPDYPRTEWDHAMKELIDAELIEELPELHCRYRLVTRPAQQSKESAQ